MTYSAVQIYCHLFYLLMTLNLFMSGNDTYQLCDSLNVELIEVLEWFRSIKLSLNAKKTNFIW